MEGVDDVSCVEKGLLHPFALGPEPPESAQVRYSPVRDGYLSVWRLNTYGT